MKQAVEVPRVGESVTSGILAVWNVADGDYVNEGDEIFELETDKATLPVPAPVAGVISIKVQADEEVEIGTVVAEIDTEAEAPAGEPAGAGAAAEGAGAAAEATAEAAGAPGAAGAAGATASEGGAGGEVHEALSPAVRRILEENGLEAAAVAGVVSPSGKDGRLTKGDVLEYLEAKGGDAGGEKAGREKAGRGGSSAPQAGKTQDGTQVQSQKSGVAGSGVAESGGARQERKRMSNLRKTIAANLVRSKAESAHLSTFNEVDMGAVMALRGEQRERFERVHGVRLGFMSFFVKAAQRALAEFPDVNAFVEGDEFVYNRFYNVGVAISTDAGLVVPVLRDVDGMDFAEVERKIVDFAERAQSRRLLPDEFAGGTFTITNGGVFGSMLSTPIPSPPQTAVLGMHAIVKRPMVVNDEIVIRPMMYLALTYDHRVIDGKQAIGFLNRIKEQIEDPGRMLLGL